MTNAKISKGLVDTSSIGKRGAEALRNMIFEAGPDAHLGSEDELMRRLGVSSAMLRQAARILEHEQLLEVRRGPGGGYYSRLPTVEAAAHVMAVLLRSHQASQRDALQVALALSELLVQGAMNSQDSGLWERLVGIAAASAGQALGEALFRLLAEMNGNLVLQLVFRTLWDYRSLLGSEHFVFMDGAEEMIELSHELAKQTALAMIQRDPGKAVERLRQMMEIAGKFIPDRPHDGL
jgi:DNA-binding FadR family transcriptional regulator